VIRNENGKIVFEFQGRNNFTRVQRAVEATRALRELGYDKETVRGAIGRAKPTWVIPTCRSTSG
jgi:hypothetical protein